MSSEIAAWLMAAFWFVMACCNGFGDFKATRERCLLYGYMQAHGENPAMVLRQEQSYETATDK